MKPPTTTPMAQGGFADQRAGSGRIVKNRPRSRRQPQQRSGVEARRNTLHPLTILNGLEQTQAIIGIVDGSIVHWSRGAERLYGWTANEAIGRCARDLLRQKRAGGSEASAPPPNHCGIWKTEFRRAHKDGHRLTVAAHGMTQPDVSGRIAVIEIDTLVEPAERADPQSIPTHPTEAKGCPIGRIAHDFNNLLGIIALNLELARERAGDGVREMIDEALDAAWQGSKLTSRLAALAQRRAA
ncbi:MAG: PAS domain S-box protein [Alphaproteobacteria bacterium]